MVLETLVTKKCIIIYKKFICSRSIIAEEKYKLYKNKFTSILRFAEKSYYSSLLVECKGDAKGTWNFLNTVINKKNRLNELPNNFECNSEHINQILLINSIPSFLQSDLKSCKCTS